MKIRIFALAAAAVLLLAGCSGLFGDDGVQDETPILPRDTDQSQVKSFLIYFKLAGQDYLVGQQHNLPISKNKKDGEIVLQQLIYGPSLGTSGMEALVNPDTRITMFTESGNTAYVTLNSQFLEPVPGTPADWQNNEDVYRQVMATRRLAVYSIANTLTELGDYSSVQLYIDTDDDGNGERPTRAMLGFIDENQDQLAEPVFRNYELIYTPAAATQSFFTLMSEKNWAAVDLMVCDNGPTEKRPSSSELVSQLQLLDVSLLQNTIDNASVGWSGESAIVVVSYVVRGKEGAEYSGSNFPMRLRRIDGVWQVTYASLNQILSKVR